MSDDAMKAALAQAERAFNAANDGAATAAELALAIAAFLRARARAAPPTLPIEWMHECAAAVERAAREGGG